MLVFIIAEFNFSHLLNKVAFLEWLQSKWSLNIRSLVADLNPKSPRTVLRLKSGSSGSFSGQFCRNKKLPDLVRAFHILSSISNYLEIFRYWLENFGPEKFKNPLTHIGLMTDAKRILKLYANMLGSRCVRLVLL